MIRLPQAPSSYDQREEAQTRRTLETAFGALLAGAVPGAFSALKVGAPVGTIATKSTACTNVSATAVAKGFLGIILVQDTTNQGSAVVLLDAGNNSVTILGQSSAATVFVTAAPAATQVQLAYSAGTMTALGGASRAAFTVRTFGLTI